MADQLQFGPFTLVISSGDLYKGKTRIRVQQHPLTVLLLLLERPGELVTREEIRSRVWPNGTIVEFDHSINTAMNKLRSALSDRAEKPRYIATVARQGYRFLVPVQLSNPQEMPSLTANPIEPRDLVPGVVVTHYRIEQLIGSGANGRVYEALDLNLSRRVALKFLTDAYAADENALERFHREARAISALDHPNICGVYEFGEHAGRRFLAMQLLEGETLAHRIETQGPIDSENLIHVALQVATGIEAAHRRGIIHRDVKPANIFLTASGQVKIVDFGLAKLAEMQDVALPPTTLTNGREALPRMTLTGALIGTAAYMSPEQIRCEEVDHRTDIFSFGLILYEMATGRHPFANVPDHEVGELLLRNAILNPTSLRPDLPAVLGALVEGALEKDRQDRISSFSAICETLEGLQPVSRQPAGERNSPRVWRKLAVPALIVFIGIALWVLGSRQPLSHPNLTVTPLTSSPGLKEHVVLSPDDSHIAFAWYGIGDNEDIFVQAMGSQSPVRLTSDPARDFSPSWSPDGQHVAFVRSRPGRAAVYIVPSTGGAERKLLDLHINPAPFCRALDWSPGGQYLAVAEWRPQVQGGPALFLVSAEDGTKVRQLLSSRGEFLCAPAFSPDGVTLALIKGPDFRVSDVYVVPAAGGAERRVTFDGRMIQGLSWRSDSTSLAYSLRRSGPFGLWQVPVRGGESRTLLETGNDIVDPHFSKKSGRLVFARDMWDTNIWRVEGPEWRGPRSGPVKVIASTREDSAVDVSPDGQLLVFASARTGAFELWTAGIDGSSARQMTHFGGPETGYPRWSPDGRRIAFTSYPDGQQTILIMSAKDGKLWRRTDGEMPFWSKDGKWIYFLRNHAGSRALWKVPADSGNAVKIADIDAAMLLPLEDAKDFLYERDDGLWRTAQNGGIPESIAQGVVHGMWNPAPGGACYLNYGLAALFTVECINFTSHETRRVASLGYWPRVYGPPGFAISADGKWIFYQRVDQLESNIMLAERIPL